jgi:ABC-type bacteriocin/lantibiotic exporter with double-glycine peptidase domain
MSLPIHFVESLKQNTLIAMLFESFEFERRADRFSISHLKTGQIIEVSDLQSTVKIPLSGSLKTLSPQGIQQGKAIELCKEINPELLWGEAYKGPPILAEEDCKLIELPSELFDEIRGMGERTKSFLKKLNIHPVFRAFVQKAYERSCELQLIIEFIECLKIRNYKPNEKIVQEGSKPSSIIFGLEGRMTASRQKKGTFSNASSSWPYPLHRWIFKKEIATESEVDFSLSSDTYMSFLIIDESDYEKLFKQYGDDLAPVFGLGEPNLGNEFEFDFDDETIDIDSEELENAFLSIPKSSRSRRFPVVIQQNEADCGPASMASVVRYYKRDIPISTIRELSDTTDQGTNVFGLAKCAESLGLMSHCIEMNDIDEMDQSLLPFIILKDKHYYVVYKMENDKYTVGDPAKGIRKFNKEEISDGLENLALLLCPTDEFYQKEFKTLSPLKYLEFFRGSTREISYALFLSIVSIIVGLFPTFLTQIIIDEVISKKDLRLLIIALGVTGIVVILNTFLSWAQAYFLFHMDQKVDFASMSSYLRKLYLLPFQFFSKRSLGDFLRVLNEMESVRQQFSREIMSVVLSMLSLFIYVLVIFIYSPTIAIAGVLLGFGFVLISLAYSGKLRRSYKNVFQKRADLDSTYAESIRGSKVIKALSLEVPARWRFEEKLVASLKEKFKFNMLSVWLSSSASVYQSFVNYGIMGFAAYLGIKGQLSPGQIVAVSMFSGKIIAPFYTLATAWADFQRLFTVIDKLTEVFGATVEDKTKGEEKLTTISHKIEFKDVWFRYGGEDTPWILKGLSFSIDVGKTIAIVGLNGSGKSTIANLILRLFEPTKGEILIDGINYNEFSIENLRKAISIVPADVTLFGGTIADNIAFGDPKPKRDLMYNVANMVGASKFIRAKMKGYNYVIQNNGFGLSEGEKQKISVARTLYHQPQILILDEATAAMDGISERNFIRDIKGEEDGRTVVAITHKPAAMKASDYIVLIDQGCVTELDTYDALISKNELFRQLCGME